MELTNSYRKSKVLFVANELGIFSVLSNTKKNAQKLVKELKLETRPIKRTTSKVLDEESLYTDLKN